MLKVMIELNLNIILSTSNEMVVKWEKKKKLSKSKRAQPKFNAAIMNHLINHSITVAFIHFLNQTSALDFNLLCHHTVIIQELFCFAQLDLKLKKWDTLKVLRDT